MAKIQAITSASKLREMYVSVQAMAESGSKTKEEDQAINQG